MKGAKMKVEEAMRLKPGDLVMIRWKKAATIYKDLVYEVVGTRTEGRWKAWVEVKQPGFDMGFRDVISASLLKRYEDVIKETHIKGTKSKLTVVDEHAWDPGRPLTIDEAQNYYK